MPLPRFKRNQRGGRGRGGVDPLAGQPAENLADIFTAFSTNKQAQLVEQASEDAAVQGFNQGLEGEELPEASNITAAGRAFNQAARLGHASAVRADIKTRLSELALQAKELPADQWVDAYVKTSDGFRDGLLSELDPSIRGDALRYFNDTAGNQRLRLLEGQQGELRKQTVNELKVGQAQLLDDINTAAREMNFELLTVRQREYETMFTAAAEAGVMDPALADAAIKEMHSVAIQGEVLGSFEAVLEGQGIDAAAKSLARFKREKATSMDLSVAEKDQLEATMTGLFNRERSIVAQAEARQAANNRAAQAALTGQANDTIRMLEAGYSTDVEDLARNLANTESFGKLAELGEAVELQGKLSVLQDAPLVAQDAMLDRMREALEAGNLSPDEFATFQAFERVRNQTATLLDKDPRSLAIQQGIIEPDEPLNFSSVGALSASLAGRRASAASASDHYGQAIPVTDTAETKALGAFWSSADVTEKLAISEAVMTGLGPHGGELLLELDKQGFKQAAFTGSLMAEGERETAASVLRGNAAMAESDELMPKGIDLAVMDDDIDAMLGRSFAHLPQFRQSSVDAIKAHYADRAAISGDFSGEFDSNRLEVAVQAVVGNILEGPNGSEFALRHVNQRQFDEWLFSLTPDMIESAGGMAGFEPDEAISAIHRSAIIAVGPGVFRFGAPDPFGDLPQFALRPDGEPFELQIDIATPPPASAPEFPELSAL